MRIRRVSWVLGLSLLPLLAQAQAPQQKMAADAAFDEGKRLMTEQKFTEACARFSESQRLDPASSTLVWLGECYEKNGKLASAWTTFREAASLAARQGKADREKMARERVAALEARVPRVLLRPPALAGLTLSLDGVALGPTLWGTPLPADAGAHSVEMLAPGKKKKVFEFQLREGHEPQPVQLPGLDDEAAAPASAAPPPGPPPPASSAAPPPAATTGEAPATQPGRSYRPVAVALGGVGLVLEVTGVVLQLGARSKADDSRARNDLALYNEASRRQTAAIVTMAAGGALMAGGVALWVLSSSSPSSTAFRAVPVISERGPGLWLGGSF